MADRLSRAVAAIKRYKWLVLTIIAVGSSAGLVATRFVDPKFDVSASIWVNTTREASGMIGPVSAPGLVNSDVGWRELARSYAVLDKVVSNVVVPCPTRFPGFTSVFPTNPSIGARIWV